MSSAHFLPGRAQPSRIETANFQADLVDIISALAVAKGMEQHSLLHRRERIDVLDLTAIDRRTEIVEVSLAQPRELDV
jgi:hypothetical protein